MAFVASALLATPTALASHRGADEYDRATELHNDRQYEAAAAQFIAAYEAGYREGTSAYNAACGLARAGRLTEAFSWLEKAGAAGFDLQPYLDDDRDLRSLRMDPRFAALRTKVQSGRASVHDKEVDRDVARNVDRAVTRYAGLAARSDAGPRGFDQAGRALLRLGRYDEAARAFMAEAERDGDRASAIYNAACARSLQGEKGAALDLLQRAVEQGFADPKHLDDDEDLDAIRGEPRFRTIHALAEELEVPPYPTQPRDRNPATDRKWQLAMPRIAAAVRKHPELGQTWFNLGFAGIALGHLAQAAPSFQKAIELGYRKPISMYNLACSYALAGHVEEAFIWLDKAFANGFDNWGMIRSDADLDSLRSDPRFRKILDVARSHEHDHDHDT